MSSSNAYDVAILGTGIGGTILGSILARHGQRVLMIEESAHPRFTIGESTVPETTLLFRVLSQRYGVPEIAHVASHQQVQRHIGTTSGVKRNFSFFYHRRGEAQNPQESTQITTAAPPLGPDVHLFRQDVDAYFLSVAASYGATIRQRTVIEEVTIEDEIVRLRARGGQEFLASYVVDAGGLKSMLAHKFQLRENPCPLRTRSRTVYTHMLGVRPPETIFGGREAHGLPSPPSQGTFHHLFDGGWMWVIPFNNHPSSTNRLVSVGLCLDIDRFPKNGVDPEEEFWAHIRAYPGMRRQFEGATAFREWFSTDRLQFSSTRAVGHRFCMLPHAFRFIDPLFSSGLGVTMSAINLIAARLIAARADGDYSAERFEPVDRWIKSNFNYYDRLVSGAYVSFRSFALWNAWMRLWNISGTLGAFASFEMYAQCRKSNSMPAECKAEEYPFRGIQGSEQQDFAKLFDLAELELDRVRRNEVAPDAAAERIFELVRESGMWPDPWGELRPSLRHTGTFTMLRLYRTGLFLRHRAPEGVRRHYYVLPRVPDILKEAVIDTRQQLATSGRALVSLLRDYFVDWNQDYERPIKSLAPVIAPPALPAPSSEAPPVDSRT